MHPPNVRARRFASLQGRQALVHQPRPHDGGRAVKPWSRREDQILREFGDRGAKYCQRLISRRFHVTRTVHAVENRASRIGVSLYPCQTCPQCGRRVARLRQTTGLCDLCHERSFIPAVEQRSEAMRQVQRDEGDPEYQRAVADASRTRLRLRKREQRRKRRMEDL